MRLLGLVVGLMSLVSLADATMGVPAPHQHWFVNPSVDAGSDWSVGFELYPRSRPARAILLYVSAVASPGPVTIRFQNGVVATTLIDRTGWHEWQLSAPIDRWSDFVIEAPSAQVTFELTGFTPSYDFPSQQQSLGHLWYRGSPCTGVIRFVGAPVANGCPAPDDDLVGGIPYVDTAALPPGTEQQRLRVPSSMGIPPSPIGTRGTFPSEAVRLIDSNGQVHLRNSQGAFTAAATGPTDGGMSDAFVLEFESDGGNLWAAYSHPPSACHPVARAGLDGDESRWIGGPSGSDLVFRLLAQGTFPLHLDLDGDGYRGPTFEWSLDSDGNWNDCDDANPLRHPGAPEVCNAVDDDCSGSVDGADVVTTACERTAGLCVGLRHLASDCQEGEWLTCEARGRYPTGFRSEEEWCDGRDEDCDGVVDDALLPLSCGLSLGVCAASQAPACVSGSWTACDYGPQYEMHESSCDGLDNDCDGLVDAADSDLQSPSCELNRGVCTGTLKSCGASGWVACTEREYGPHFEQHEASCDGLDNDCDGLTDADDSDLATVLCENQAGVCAGSTHVAAECDVSTWHPCAKSRLPNTWEQLETRCDGLDNDCDGVTDEGCVARPVPPPEQKAEGCACATGSSFEWGLLLLALLLARRKSSRAAP